MNGNRAYLLLAYEEVRKCVVSFFLGGGGRSFAVFYLALKSVIGRARIRNWSREHGIWLKTWTEPTEANPKYHWLLHLTLVNLPTALVDPDRQLSDLQISLWDAIIQSEEHAQFQTSIANKYRFTDQVKSIVDWPASLASFHLPSLCLTATWAHTFNWFFAFYYC